MADGVTTRWSYFFSGKPAETKLGGRLMEAHEYDIAGRLSWRYKRGYWTEYEFDDADRLRRINTGVNRSTGAVARWEETSL